MDGLLSLKELLESGADVAIILFAYFLWRMDRRLLIVEMEIKNCFATRGEE